MRDDASAAQYGPPVPTPTTCVACGAPDAGLPRTGGGTDLEVMIGGPLLLVGVVLAILARWSSR